MTNSTKNDGRQAAKIQLGATGPSVFPLGLGCMALSGMYGPTSEAEGIRTIHAAMDAGITLLDTGDFYGTGHNELLIGRAIADRRDKVQLSVKFGALRGPDGAWLGYDGRPASVKNFAAHSLRRLGVEVIDVYRPSRLDPAVPIEDTIGAIADMVKAGYVRHIGLSEVGVETIRRAVKVHPIVDLQIEYAISSRSPEEKIFPVLDELGLSATLYAVFGRGLLTGKKPTGAQDFRSYLPRFAGDTGAANNLAVERFAAYARDLRATPAQLALAWVRAKAPRYLPLVGARTVEQLHDAIGALSLTLTEAQLAELEAIVNAETIQGTRYAAQHMAMLDSEK